MKRQRYDPSDASATVYSTDSSESSVSQCCNIHAFNVDVVRRKKPTPSEGEMAVINDLNALSVSDREEVYEEIHGISTNTVPESPGLVEAKIKELEDCLHKMKRTYKQAYEVARLMSPRFVHNRESMLMFLRADLFDAKKAAARVAVHFQIKLELFGIDKLVKQITWDDLSEDDQASVLNCAAQFLKDSSGRTVWFVAMEKDTYKTEGNNMRASWYNMNSMLAGNEHAQKHGIVGVAYMVSLSGDKFSNRLAGQSMKFISALPFRYAALHVCYDNAKFKAAIGLVQLLADMQTRVRFRAHFGTHMECLYMIMAFGLNQNTFPLDDAGNLRTGKRLEELAFKQQQEAQLEAEKEQRYRETGLIEYPASLDVLFGRGKLFNEFVGNARMYAFIDQYKSRYAMATAKHEKTILAETVLMMVKERGGRFLKRAPNELDGWLAVTDGVAKEKISHTFRNRLKP